MLKMGERVGLQSFLLVPSVFVLSSAFAFFHDFSPAFFPCEWEDKPQVVQSCSSYISHVYTAAPSTHLRQYKRSWESEESAVCPLSVPSSESK